MNLFKRMLLLIALIATTCIVFTSCSDYDYGYEKAEIAYEYEFSKEFGNVYNGQTWGFDNQTVVNVSETRTVLTNLNEWYGKYKLKVPGMPEQNHGLMLGSNSTSITYAEARQHDSDENWVTNNVGNPLGDVTEEERAWVYNWFNTNKNPKGVAIHWSDFFIQYVNSYNEQENIFDQSGRYMDYLGYESINGFWEHVNNFNVSTHAMQYVRDAGTENWTYRSSFDDTYHNNRYVIVYLSFDIPQTNCEHGCASHHYEGWYVGLDYEAIVYEGDGSLRSGSVFADGYYSDWIVKVTPGLKQDYPYTTRVMCEDLGNSYDWDYNDVVFDVSFEQDWEGVTAIITLRAAGGTMPINVGNTDDAYEVHRLLGVNSNVVCVRPSAPVIYRVKVNGWYGNARDIDIVVQGNDKAVYILKADKVPQKFCCPNIVDWSDELVDIRKTYPKWSQWVENNSVEFWK